MDDWGGVGQAYRASFARLCAGTIETLLQSATGTTLLDVGCGTGDLLAAAARRGFSVEGVDADPEMVAMSEAVVPGRVRRAALPHLPYADGAFDTVVANFVVNHVPDPRAAMRELARVTAPGGRVAATIWPAGGAGWGPLVADVFASAGVVPLTGGGLPEHLDFPRTADGLAGIAREAGLRVLDAHDVEWVWHVAPDDFWAGIAGGVATPGQTFRAQTPEVQAAAEAAFFSRARADFPDGPMAFPCRAALVVGTR